MTRSLGATVTICAVVSSVAVSATELSLNPAVIDYYVLDRVFVDSLQQPGICVAIPDVVSPNFFVLEDYTQRKDKDTEISGEDFPALPGKCWYEIYTPPDEEKDTPDKDEPNP